MAFARKQTQTVKLGSIWLWLQHQRKGQYPHTMLTQIAHMAQCTSAVSHISFNSGAGTSAGFKQLQQITRLCRWWYAMDEELLQIIF